MIKIRVLNTGDIKEVTRNIAHDLIERGLAEVYSKSSQKRIETIQEAQEEKTEVEIKPQEHYPNRQMKSKPNF